MGDFHQQRLKHAAANGVATHSQAAQRVAVVALTPGDESGALRLADLHEILSGHLQGGLNCLGTAGDEVNLANAFGGTLDQRIRQFLGRFGSKKRGVGEGQALRLLNDCAAHVRVAVSEA